MNSPVYQNIVDNRKCFYNALFNTVSHFGISGECTENERLVSLYRTPFEIELSSKNFVYFLNNYVIRENIYTVKKQMSSKIDKFLLIGGDSCIINDAIHFDVRDNGIRRLTILSLSSNEDKAIQRARDICMKHTLPATIITQSHCWGMDIKGNICGYYNEPIDYFVDCKETHFILIYSDDFIYDDNEAHLLSLKRQYTKTATLSATCVCESTHDHICDIHLNYII